MTMDTRKMKNGKTNDRKEHVLKYKLPMDNFVSGDLRLVASLVDDESKSNIASIGFNDELLVKVTNSNPDSGGLIHNCGTISIA